MIDLKKSASENERQFIWRLASAKDAGTLDMDWEELASIFNKELRDEDTEYTSSAWRKPYQQARSYYEDVFSKMIDGQYSDELMDQKRELETLKVRFRDERNAWNKQNYIAARANETFEYLENKLKNIGTANYEVHDTPSVVSDKDMIVCLSDLHIGAYFSSAFGEFDSTVAKKRLNKYLNKVIEVGKMHKVEKVYLVGLGDIVNGNIHLTIQVSNKENVIDQTKLAIEYITDFCYKLTKEFNHVYFANCVGNHSRLIAKKDEAVKDERLDDLIGWSVIKQLEHIENFHSLAHRNIDTGIVNLNVRGKTYIGIHGDNDSMTKQGMANLSMMLGFFPDCVIAGHLHHPTYAEESGIMRVQCGSLCGSGDDYTISKRLSGNASKTMLVCDDKGIECIYNVTLD